MKPCVSLMPSSSSLELAESDEVCCGEELLPLSEHSPSSGASVVIFSPCNNSNLDFFPSPYNIERENVWYNT